MANGTDTAPPPVTTPPATTAPSAIDSLDGARKQGVPEDQIFQYLKQSRGISDDYLNNLQKEGYSLSDPTDLKQINDFLVKAPKTAQAAPNTTRVNSLAQRRNAQAQPGITPAMRAADPTNQKVISTLKAIPPVAAGAAASIVAPEVLPALADAGTATNVIRGAVSGAASGGAGGAAESGTEQAMEGKNPISTETLKGAAKGAVGGAALGSVTGPAEAAALREEEAAARSAATAAQTAQAAKEAATKKAASTVYNMASKAADNGVTLNADKSVYDQFITNAKAGDRNVFLKEVQPKLTEAAQKAGIQNVAHLDPEEAIRYRDAVQDALSDSKFDSYRSDILSNINKDIRGAMKNNSIFTKADKAVEGSKVTDLITPRSSIPAPQPSAASTPVPKQAPAAATTAPVPKKAPNPLHTTIYNVATSPVAPKKVKYLAKIMKATGVLNP